MSSETHKIVALAIELIECGMKAFDTTREAGGARRAGGYSAKDWAIDVLRRLPDDRGDALAIIKAHSPGQEDFDNRRRVSGLCRAYYKRLANTGLLKEGQRLLKYK